VKLVQPELKMPLKSLSMTNMTANKILSLLIQIFTADLNNPHVEYISTEIIKGVHDNNARGLKTSLNPNE
jgi:hypothetical protein